MIQKIKNQQSTNFISLPREVRRESAMQNEIPCLQSLIQSSRFFLICIEDSLALEREFIGNVQKRIFSL